MKRALFIGTGWLAVALGVAGIALPLLPTTPFLLLAAFCFGRGSPAAREWLVNHARLGPPVRDWEARGAIPRRAKIWAVVAMAASFAVSLALALPATALALQALALAGAATFVLTRPE
ncbi:MAG: YbaN family protein [Tranquillimonas sp.]|jgi:uncharacterized membrane protein YbaN (DUF454 family)